MSVGHVDEIMLVVFESDSCSFLELLWVIDIDKIVVLHLLMTLVPWTVLGLRLVVEWIGRTFSFDAGHSQMTGFCSRSLQLFALATLLNVCPRYLPLCSAACSHLWCQSWFIFWTNFIKFIRSLPSFPRSLTSRACACFPWERRVPSLRSFYKHGFWEQIILWLISVFLFLLFLFCLC